MAQVIIDNGEGGWIVPDELVSELIKVLGFSGCAILKDEHTWILTSDKGSE